MIYMITITIPKKLIKNDDLVVIPRREYEDFLVSRLKSIKEIELTSKQKKAINTARKNIARGNFITIHELRRKLGIKS